jgi:hypothetical protein
MSHQPGYYQTQRVHINSQRQFLTRGSAQRAAMLASVYQCSLHTSYNWQRPGLKERRETAKTGTGVRHLRHCIGFLTVRERSHFVGTPGTYFDK